MRSAHNASFLLTEQERYSDQLFNKSIMRVRKRINILSTSAVTADPDCPEDRRTGKEGRTKGNASGLCAALAKLTFEAEMLEQDVKGERLELRKSRQVVAILAEDLRRRTQKAEQLMRFELQELQQEVDHQREANIQRGRRIAAECEQRRRKGEHLKERLQEAARRVKALEASLGCYTATEKLEHV